MKICSVEHSRLEDGVEVLSSRKIDWNGIIVEQYQAPPNRVGEQSPGALLAYLLNFPSVQPIHLTQQHGERWHELIVKQGDLVLVPAGRDKPLTGEAQQIALCHTSAFTCNQN
jgi:AraC family transcriptional regulator